MSPITLKESLNLKESFSKMDIEKRLIRKKKP